METELKDVLHLYLHCGIKGFKKNSNVQNKKAEFLSYYIMQWVHGSKCRTFKPILRPLSNMKKEECEILNCLFPLPSTFKKSDEWTSDDFLFLLKQGFDLFGLIESGQAIDVTALKK